MKKADINIIIYKLFINANSKIKFIKDKRAIQKYIFYQTTIHVNLVNFII